MARSSAIMTMLTNAPTKATMMLFLMLCAGMIPSQAFHVGRATRPNRAALQACRDDVAARVIRVPMNVTLLNTFSDEQLLPLKEFMEGSTTASLSSSSPLSPPKYRKILHGHADDHPMDLEYDGKFAIFHSGDANHCGEIGSNLNSDGDTNEDDVMEVDDDVDEDDEDEAFDTKDIFEKMLLHGETPLRYIRRSLTVGEDCLLGGYTINHNAKGNDAETVILCGPALDMTMDQTKDMVQFASSALQELPLSYLHCASHSDLEFKQPNIDDGSNGGHHHHTACSYAPHVPLLDAAVGNIHHPTIQRLVQDAIDQHEATNTNDDDNEALFTAADPQQVQFVVQNQDLDRLRMVLAGRPGLYDTDFKRSVRKMIDTAVASLSKDDGGDCDNDGESDSDDEDGDDDDLLQQKQKQQQSGYGQTATPQQNQQQQPHLVLMCYSAATNQVAAAISEWIEDSLTPSTNSMSPCARQILEESLKKSLTVVTIGSTCSSFPDGPQYIHVSMRDDPIASKFGVMERILYDENWDYDDDEEDEETGTIDLGLDGGGKNAVFLHAYSPYFYAPDTVTPAPSCYDTLPLSNDAHNLRACLVQWLSLVMRVNGSRSFRFLYSVMAKDDLDNPFELEDEVLPAMIRATEGHKWLWNPAESLGACDVMVPAVEHELPSFCDTGCDDPVIPDADEARYVLEHQFGYGGYDEIVETMEPKVVSPDAAAT